MPTEPKLCFGPVEHLIVKVVRKIQPVDQRIRKNLDRAYRAVHRLHVRNPVKTRRDEKIIGRLWHTLFLLERDVLRENKSAFKRAKKLFNEGWRIEDTSEEEYYGVKCTLHHNGDTYEVYDDGGDMFGYWERILKHLGIEGIKSGFYGIDCVHYLFDLTAEEKK